MTTSWYYTTPGQQPFTLDVLPAQVAELPDGSYRLTFAEGEAETYSSEEFWDLVGTNLFDSPEAAAFEQEDAGELAAIIKAL